MATLPEQCAAQGVPVLLVERQVRLVVGVDEKVAGRLEIVAAALDEPDEFYRNLVRVFAQPVGGERGSAAELEPELEVRMAFTCCQKHFLVIGPDRDHGAALA
jgi:hypothetical protein